MGRRWPSDWNVWNYSLFCTSLIKKILKTVLKDIGYLQALALIGNWFIAYQLHLLCAADESTTPIQWNHYIARISCIVKLKKRTYLSDKNPPTTPPTVIPNIIKLGTSFATHALSHTSSNCEKVTMNCTHIVVVWIIQFAESKLLFLFLIYLFAWKRLLKGNDWAICLGTLQYQKTFKCK